MTDRGFLKQRLPIMVGLLIALELVNLFKLGKAMAWTNEGPLAILAAAVLGAFLIGSIIALSFNLEPGVRNQLQVMVTMLFLVQTALVCIVSFIYSLSLMPAEQIASLFGTAVEPTRRTVALLEGAAISVAAFAFWRVAGEIWRAEIDERRTRLSRLMEREIEAVLDDSQLNSTR
jgi:hypothetical protein